MKDMANPGKRRTVLRNGLIGAGLILGMLLAGKGRKTAGDGNDEKAFVPNAFLTIGSDDSIIIYMNKAEMGQGIYTALPMLIAEELEADWGKIRIRPAPVHPDYNHTLFEGIMVTGGSTSVLSEWDRLRYVGATARHMLIEAAAGLWAADPSECKAENGYVIHPDSGKKASFGELAGKAAWVSPPSRVVLKSPDQFKIIGTSKARLDLPEKTNGKAVFGIDVNVPGMLVVLISRPPVFGAVLKSCDDKETLKVKGVRQTLVIDRGVAVVADGFWSAKQGREALKIEWDEGDQAGLDSDIQTCEYAKTALNEGRIAVSRGDVAEAIDNSKTTFEAVYEFPYLAHAPMEPLNCVAHVRPDGCDIWTGSQLQTVDRDTAAAITGLPPEKVMLHNTLLGGGFGRRAVPDSHFVAEAVRVSMAVKAPVKVYWTREDDIQGGYYRPKAYNLIKAALGEDGIPVALKHTIVSQSIVKGTAFEDAMLTDGIDHTSVEGSADSPYRIPNLQVEYHMPPAVVPVLWWRAVGHSYNAYVKECVIDELAGLAGRDPYEYRCRLLPDTARERGVLDMAAQQSGWSAPVKKGRARGMAVHASFGSYVAQVAEVSLLENGTARVHRVTCAVDCGRTVNPDTIVAQMESGIAFGLSAALYNEIRFKKGRVQQHNFNDYKLLSIKEMPEVHVHIVDSKEAPGGVGEIAVPPIAPAVANAVAALTGRRIRSLPFQREKIKKP